MSRLDYHLCNSFPGDTSHSGSQCAVVLLPEGDERLEDATYLQSVAWNFDYPATAFVRPVKGRQGDEAEYDLRWFAEGELPFCGHGTVAASHTLFSLLPDSTNIKFNAKPGVLSALKTSSGVELSLPEIPYDKEKPSPDVFLQKIGQVTSITPNDVVEVATFTWSGVGIIVELKSEFDLANAKIDGRGLANTEARMIIFTQIRKNQEGKELGIASRVFLPNASAVEDPVTGSAHTALTVYYSLHPSPQSRVPSPVKIASQDKPMEIDAIQLSRRGGGMKTRYEDGRVIITAKAVTWAKGTLE